MSNEHADNTADGWTEFTHAGERWSFDADSLCLWDEEDQHFEFRIHHELAEPTVDALIQVIEQRQIIG